MRLPAFPLLFAFALLLSWSCEDQNTGVAFNPPDCELLDLTPRGGTTGTPPSLEMTVENTSNVSDAFFAQAQVEARLNDVVVTTALATYGNLGPGRQATETADLVGIERHDEYDELVITLVWFDADGAYYEEVVVR